MKKILQILFFGSLISTANVVAQPTLTASGINPAVGDQINSNGANYVSPGNAGANQTWDLSAMVSSGSGSFTYTTASSTTYASSYPNANVATNASGEYVYYKTSATTWQFYGAVTSVTMSYSNPEDMLRFPFTYNNSYIDTWATTFINGGYTFYRTGKDSVSADSYGTLITPAGTFTNVLRVHFVQNYQDSVYISSTSMITTYHNDEYMWYLNGNHNPIATVYDLTSSSGPLAQQGNYMSNVSGINEPSVLISYNLFPNPSSENLNVNLNLKEDQKIEIKIFNLSGELIEVPVSANAKQGTNDYRINVNNLPAGIYFAEMILNGQSTSTRRFTVSK
jgi:hypothetical protein